MKSSDATNAMRILERKGISFIPIYYASDGFMDGVSVANKLGLETDRVFKTLVAEAKDGEHIVFVIPVAEELDLKKAATAAGVKSVSMLHVSELTRVTGYVRGGCSPIGMKKKLRTFIDETAGLFDTIYVSAGRLGAQMELSPESLANAAGAVFADIVFG